VSEVPKFQDPLCSQVDPEIFFPMEIPGISANVNVRNAKSICRQCEHVAPCLEYAMKYNVAGVWGGFTERERTDIRRRRGIKVRPADYSKLLSPLIRKGKKT